MIKLFVTGDIHIGKKYDRYPQIKEKLIQSRFDCLERCVTEAEHQHCDFFVITGDLFDNISSIKAQDVRDVAAILARFDGRVLVLPGNHDYYTGEEKVWRDFQNALSKLDHNVILITAFEKLRFDLGEETVSFYPAFCQSKHSPENNLAWIKDTEMDDADYHVGLAHGALKGVTPDLKNEYFLMAEKELLAIPVDAWLIGHTHIPYPAELSEKRETKGFKIFNAGTPEQTDLSNDTNGLCFVITLDCVEGKTVVSAHSFESGQIRYFDIPMTAGEDDLAEMIRLTTQGLPDSSVIRLTLKGTIPEEQYAAKQQAYDAALGRFLTYEIVDTELCERITVEKIRSEFAEIGFAAKLLEALTDPREVQMAYELIRKHQK